ncbi:MAG: hypothetical protein GX548_06395 [Lentisphaerae bacterium]|nr:hypothetical protein [Lentisphaerota bacterium]
METAPATSPVSFTTSRAPAGRGDECCTPARIASALATPASSHART